LRRARLFFLTPFVLALFAGCAHAPGRLLWRGAAPVDAEARQALDALARAQDMLGSLRGQGTCIAASQDVMGKRKFNVTLLYRAPRDVAVRGFDSTGLSGQVLRLVAVDGTLEVAIPETALDVSEMLGRAGADSIARELMRPEEWGKLGGREVKVANVEETGDGRRLTLLVNKRFGLLRRVTLEGPDWKLRESELLDKRGAVLARVEWQEYLEVGGVRAPVAFAAAFPQEGLTLRFSLEGSKVAINPGLTTADFLAQPEEMK